MKVLEILVEHRVQALNRPFSFLYFGTKKVDKGYRVTINFHEQDLVGYVLKVYETNKTKQELEEESGYEYKVIKDVLDDCPLLNEELLDLANEITNYYVASKIAVLQTMLPASLSPRSSTLKAPKIAYDYYVAINKYDEEGLTIKQIELLRLIALEKKILKKDIKSKSILEKLIEKDLVYEIKEEKRRLQLPNFEYQEPPLLTDDQNNVIEQINKSSDLIYLLEGVTGSGKTEVYLNLIEQTLKENKSALFLVPEISLTPIMMEYLIKRFNNQVAILHGELTQAEKYDEYRRIFKGDAKVVIGARSAIFAPIKNLGLIILDEEHVESYKQDEAPHYHAREVAIMRSKYINAKLILGSATPSLETKARAQRGIYHQLNLTKRINQRPLPETKIVNLCDKRNLTRESSMFSKELIGSIKEALNNNEQIILLLNRRGFSNNVTCRNCGHIFRCDNCGIPLTYHKTDNLLKCHHCDHVEEYPKICPECGGTYFMRTGFGSERVQDEVNRLFPEAKTIRIDSDTTKSRTNLPKLLESFRNKEANILIGTQMIAKGHDFPGVSLVGIVLADQGLSMPSYRSSERTFQLITQAIGRCGRGEIPGKAIIQTYLPKHYSITLAAEQNYTKFYITEMANRKIQNYPPFSYLTSISIISRKEESSIAHCEYIIEEMKKFLNENDASIIGPITPFLAIKHSGVERQILIKYRDKKLINEVLTHISDIYKYKSGVDFAINVDPYNF